MGNSFASQLMDAVGHTITESQDSTLQNLEQVVQSFVYHSYFPLQDIEPFATQTAGQWRVKGIKTISL